MSRVAAVTGAGSGMGQSIAATLAADGHRVAVIDVNPEAADKVAAEILAQGGRAIAVPCDVSDEQGVNAAFDTVRKSFGPVEILVTSAAISGFTRFDKITLDEFNRYLAVNLTGTFLCVQRAVPDMIDARWGRIVTISSAAGQWGTARLVHYAAAKGGVIAMTKALAREVAAHAITVNTVPPGLIASPMSHGARDDGDLNFDEVLATKVPMGRPGTVNEIAATVEFLCSEEASYITGQVYAVNGGMVI